MLHFRNFAFPQALPRLIIAILAFCVATVSQAAPPPGWTAQVIGSPATPGTVNYNATTGQTAITGPGHVVDYGSDSFQFIYQALNGDGDFIARVISQTNSASYPHAGLMLRASLAANSAFAEVYAAPDGVTFRSRDTTGASMDNHTRQSISVPVWIKISRFGNHVTAYTSSDAVLWTNISDQDLPLGTTVYMGLSVTSTTSGGGGVSTFSGLNIRTAPAPAGGATVYGTSSAFGSATPIIGQPNSFILTSNGHDLGGSNPSFLFFSVPFFGDGEIKMRVSGMSVSGGNSNVGLMIRNSLAADSFYASIALSTNGLKRQHTKEIGGNATFAYGSAAVPTWLKLVRNGVLITAFSSADGSTWQPIGKAFAEGFGATAYYGLTLVCGSNGGDFVQATVEQVSWPVPAPAGVALDPVIAAGLAAWRKPDPNGVSCVDCHTPFAYDIAQFNFTQADVRLATTLHLPQSDADAIFALIEKMRVQYPPAGGLKDFRTFRPLQPGGGQVIGGEMADANVRDATFGFYLQDHFLIGKDRITNLAQARAAGQELIDVNVANVPIGLKFNLWSRSVLREGAIPGGEIAEWLPSVGTQPKPEFKDYWFRLQDNYLRDPSDANFWAIYHASSYWTALDSHNFIPGSTHNNWRYVVTNQYLANSLLAHDELLKARGLPSTLAAQDGVRPFLNQRDISSTELAPFWVVGDNARVVQNQGFPGFPLRNKETVYYDTSYNGNVGETSGWQVNDFRLTWFWMGWMMDNSLRFSGEGSTLSGEYFIGSLWSGEVDNLRTGDSDSKHGFRMHQVFFNAVQQFKLGYKPGAWRDNDGPQHFEASKGYYLGYYRWHTSDSYTTDIGLPGANALYKKLLSNHLRMAILVHTDEARKAGGVYYGEQYTLADIALWRDALTWADPAWVEADEASLTDLKASLNAPLTAIELGDQDNDGQSLLLENALGTSSTVANAPGAPVTRNANGRLAITFTRVRADYTYVVEASSNLTDWAVIVTNPGSVNVPQTVEDLATSSSSSRFLRLRIINAIL